MIATVVGAYALGTILGLISVRISRFRAIWSRIIRTQILAVASIASVTSVWTMNSWNDILWPALLTVAMAVILVLGIAVTKPPLRGGRGGLLAWTGMANTGFFVVPVASALVGAPGVIAGVLMDRISTPVWAMMTHLLRRDAPIQQRTHTAWIDQAPLIGVILGFILHALVPVPNWVSIVTAATGPVFALTGAAIFVGSALHPTQRISSRGGVRPWLIVVTARAILLAPLVYFAPSMPLAVVSVLAALSITTFGPAQFSTMYGYAEPYVAAATKYGWLVGAAGLIAAGLMVHFS